MRDTALSLLSGVPDRGLIDDFAESPNLDVVVDLADLWLQLRGWIPNSGQKNGDFEIGEEASGEAGRQDEDNADVGSNRKKIFDVKSMDTMTVDSGDCIQEWTIAGKEDILATQVGTAADSGSSRKLSSRSGSVLSFSGDYMSKMTVNANKETLAMTREAFAMEDSRTTNDFVEELRSIKSTSVR